MEDAPCSGYAAAGCLCGYSPPPSPLRLPGHVAISATLARLDTAPPPPCRPLFLDLQWQRRCDPARGGGPFGCCAAARSGGSVTMTCKLGWRAIRPKGCAARGEHRFGLRRCERLTVPALCACVNPLRAGGGWARACLDIRRHAGSHQADLPREAGQRPGQVGTLETMHGSRRRGWRGGPLLGSRALTP